MASFVKTNNVQKEVVNCKVKTNGEWKDAVEVLTKVNGKWVRAWKGDFIDLNVFYSSTEPYLLIEEYYDNLPNDVAFIGLEISVYGENNRLLSRTTEGTIEEPNVIASASYNLFADADGEKLGELNILVSRSAGRIEYSLFINSGTPARRIEVRIEKILLNK